MSTNGTTAAPEAGARPSGASTPRKSSVQLGSLRLSPSEQRPTPRRSGWWKALGLLVVVVGAGLYYADSKGLLSLSPRVEKQVFQGHAVSRAAAEVVLSLSGVIMPETTIDVTPLVPGPIVELPVREGAMVKKGDLLARILDTNYIADLHQAEASLALAESQLMELKNGTRPEDIARVKAQLASGRADLVLQEKSFERIESIFKQGAVTPAERDVTEAKLKTAQATVDRLEAELQLAEVGPRGESITAAEAEVARARAALEKAQFFCEHARVLAPSDGLVIERNAELGELSRSDYFLTSLCVIGDLSHAEVLVDVQERQLRRIEIGQSCRVVPDAYPDAVYEATVSRIQPKVNRQRGVVRVIVALRNSDSKLLSEMNARVEFLDTAVLAAEADVLPVPNEAVPSSSTTPVVYKWSDGHIKAVPVELLGKTTSGDFTLVRGDLKQNDVVVLVTREHPPGDGVAAEVEVSNAVDVD